MFEENVAESVTYKLVKTELVLRNSSFVFCKQFLTFRARKKCNIENKLLFEISNNFQQF